MVGFDVNETLDEAFRNLIATMQTPAPVLRVELSTAPTFEGVTRFAAEYFDTPVRLNVGRLREALEFVTANPKYWQQNVWARRNMCAGYEGELEFVGCLGYHITRLAGHSHGYVSVCGETWTVADGRHMYEAAREAIGLSRLQADDLFHPGNSLEDLWNIAEGITEGAISSPFRRNKVKEIAW